MSHDSYRCQMFSRTAPFPTKREPGVGNYVGSVIALNDTIPMRSGFECPTKCRPKQHRDWNFC